jgi:hypothetical protein
MRFGKLFNKCKDVHPNLQINGNDELEKEAGMMGVKVALMGAN